MKSLKLALAFVALFFFSTTVYAEPFLAFHPEGTTTVDAYQLKINGGDAIDIDPSVNFMVFDLGSIPNGEHTVLVRGKKGLWWSQWKSLTFSAERPVIAEGSVVAVPPSQ